MQIADPEDDPVPVTGQLSEIASLFSDALEVAEQRRCIGWVLGQPQLVGVAATHGKEETTGSLDQATLVLGEKRFTEVSHRTQTRVGWSGTVDLQMAIGIRREQEVFVQHCEQLDPTVVMTDIELRRIDSIGAPEVAIERSTDALRGEIGHSRARERLDGMKIDQMEIYHRVVEERTWLSMRIDPPQTDCFAGFEFVVARRERHL